MIHKMLLLGVPLVCTSAQWAPVPSPLMTRWSKDVSPDQSPEYPLPQMVRSPGSWQHLNGLWEIDYEAANLSSPPIQRTLPHNILVPYPLESALSGVRVLAPHFCMWYRRLVKAEGMMPRCTGRRLLHFERVDWNATVYVNGSLRATHFGGYDPFYVDLGLESGGDTEFVIGVYDATEMKPEHNQPYGKQQRAAFSHPSGMMYTSSSGIWDTVWLECVPDVYVSDVFIQPDIDSGTVAVSIDVAGSTMAQSRNVSAQIFDGDKEIAHNSGPASTPLVLSVPSAQLWSPASPFLYNMTVRFGNDAVRLYFGMRKISVAMHPKTNKFVVMLNNEPFYQIGTLDQGWFPDGLYAAPTDAALQSDLLAMKEMGFNAVRKHMKVDTRRWFYHCDRLGLMVWQDMPHYDGGRLEDFENILWPEIKRIHKGLRNSPALVQWNAFNEGWGEDTQQYSNRTVSVFLSLEQGRRLINDASGGRGFLCEWPDPSKCPNGGQGDSRCMSIFWTGGCTGDVVDHHHYPEPEVPYDLGEIAALAGRPFLQGEYGGYSLNVDGHQWSTQCGGTDRDRASCPKPTAISWAVGLPDPGLTNAYEHYNSLAGAALHRGLAGQIFTQITDIECERNGLLTYDRLPKVDFAIIAQSNAALLRNASQLLSSGVNKHPIP